MFNNLRQDLNNWTLDSDIKLFKKIEQLSVDLLKKAQLTHNTYQLTEYQINQIETVVNSNFCRFEMLSNSKFMENRVQPININDKEFSRMSASSQKPQKNAKESQELSQVQKFANALKFGIQSLKKVNEQQDEDDKTSIAPSMMSSTQNLVKSQFVQVQRIKQIQKLPCYIGSSSFFNDDYLAMIDKKQLDIQKNKAYIEENEDQKEFQQNDNQRQEFEQNEIRLSEKYNELKPPQFLDIAINQQFNLMNEQKQTLQAPDLSLLGNQHQKMNNENIQQQYQTYKEKLLFKNEESNQRNSLTLNPPNFEEIFNLGVNTNKQDQFKNPEIAVSQVISKAKDYKNKMQDIFGVKRTETIFVEDDNQEVNDEEDDGLAIFGKQKKNEKFKNVMQQSNVNYNSQQLVQKQQNSNEIQAKIEKNQNKEDEQANKKIQKLLLESDEEQNEGQQEEKLLQSTFQLMKKHQESNDNDKQNALITQNEEQSNKLNSKQIQQKQQVNFGQLISQKAQILKKKLEEEDNSSNSSQDNFPQKETNNQIENQQILKKSNDDSFHSLNDTNQLEEEGNLKDSQDLLGLKNNDDKQVSSNLFGNTIENQQESTNLFGIPSQFQLKKPNSIQKNSAEEKQQLGKETQKNQNFEEIQHSTKKLPTLEDQNLSIKNQKQFKNLPLIEGQEQQKIGNYQSTKLPELNQQKKNNKSKVLSLFGDDQEDIDDNNNEVTQVRQNTSLFGIPIQQPEQVQQQKETGKLQSKMKLSKLFQDSDDDD